VKSLDDIQAKKIRSSGGAHALVQEALGGVPTSVTSPQIYTAMQRGVIDMISLTDAVVKIFNLQEVTKYRTDVNVTRLNFERCISKRWYDALPDDLQAVMDRFVPVMAQAETQILYRLAGAQAREVFRKAGMEFIALSTEEEARWQQAAASLIDDFIAENEAEGRPARQLVDDMRALANKYGGMSANQLTQLAIDNPSSALAAHW
jgi:TRAP-type C4-dicarboxylate transport system substrate-binding protein